jgi:hypothetical protein
MLSRLRVGTKLPVLLALPVCALILLAQEKQFSNRTEGTWQLHGAADMELISLTRGPINFPQNSTLHVHFFLPMEASPSSVTIQARETIQIQNYFMHSKAGHWQLGSWNDFSPWPTADVIDTIGIKPENLAVAASCRLDSGILAYLPLDISTATNAESNAVYTLQFATTWPLHSLEESVTGPSGRTIALPLMQCAAGPACVLYEADSVFSLTIDMTKQPAGLYKLHLIGRVPNSSFRPELSAEIYHK